MRFIIVALMLLSTALPLGAQELFVNGGGSKNIDEETTTYAWSISYLQPFGEHLAFSIMYLNEGHHSDQHRDGLAPQIWGRVMTMERKLSLGVGVGPYLYSDSDLSPAGDTYHNVHGVGLISSFAATWYGVSPLLFQVRADYIVTSNSFDSIAATFGIGYQLDATPASGPMHPNRIQAANNEITGFLGASVPNNSRSESAFSQSLEYRRRLSQYFEWTAAFLNEGNSSSSVSRYGLATQVWAVRQFYADHLVLGIGAGPYLLRDSSHDEGSTTTVAALVSLTGSYRFSPHWAVRFTWNRVLADYDRDADVFMGGLAYRF